MHSLLRSFYDLYTAGAVSEMKRSGIELKHSEKRTAGAVSEMDLTFFDDDIRIMHGHEIKNFLIYIK